MSHTRPWVREPVPAAFGELLLQAFLLGQTVQPQLGRLVRMVRVMSLQVR